MNFNKRQIGILLCVLFVLLAIVLAYSHSLVVSGIDEMGETITNKQRKQLVELTSYNTIFLIAEFFIGLIATILVISQKRIFRAENKINLQNEDIYQIEDLVVEKEEVIIDEKNDELKLLTNDINAFCKKNLSHYDFCKGILSVISTHLPLVQGAFYNSIVVNNDDYVELTAGYAFNKPEHGKIKFLYGEGLVGQAAKSRETARITELPASYMEVNSGLGSSNKVSLFEFPLLRKKELVGVIELAFFKVLSKKEIKEIEKFTSTIAKRNIELKQESQN